MEFFHHQHNASTVNVVPTPGVNVTMTTETLLQKIEGGEKKFISVLEQAGKDAEKGLVFAQKYALPLASLAGILFPAAAPGATAVVTAVGLIQNAVLEIKAKASALPTGLTPAQMLADEIQLVEPAVVSLLASEHITIDSAELAAKVQAVVAILNSQAVL